MRLWHEKLLDKLPREQILGQHREACALRGNGWHKKHKTVDYVLKSPFLMLVAYHFKVMSEMERRGYNVDPEWKEYNYRGKTLGYDAYTGGDIASLQDYLSRDTIYPEHNDEYMQECLDNLKRKGVIIELDK